MYLCLPQQIIVMLLIIIGPQIVKPYIDYKASVIFFVLKLVQLSAFMSAVYIYTRSYKCIYLIQIFKFCFMEEKHYGP